MDSTEKTREQLLEELTALRGRVSELEGRRAASKEDRLKLAIIDRAPFSMWACNRKFEIVLWTAGSPKIYGFRKEDAAGKNYLSLFVDPPEREQSEIDCLRIIDEDYVQANFLAWDVTQSGEHRTMLTNCFRIWDEDNGEFLQAEVAVDISDLELRKDEFRTVREAGVARLAEKARTVELQRRLLLGRLQDIYAEKLSTHKRRQQDLDEWTKRLRVSGGAAQAEQVVGPFRETLEGTRRKFQAEYKELSTRISSVHSIEELDQIETKVEEFASEDFDKSP